MRSPAISPRFTCPRCGESFYSDPVGVSCPRCGAAEVRSAPGERFSEHDPSGSVLTEALNESLRRLKATQSQA